MHREQKNTQLSTGSDYTVTVKYSRTDLRPFNACLSVDSCSKYRINFPVHGNETLTKSQFHFVLGQSEGGFVARQANGREAHTHRTWERGGREIHTML